MSELQFAIASMQFIPIHPCTPSSHFTSAFDFARGSPISG